MYILSMNSYALFLNAFQVTGKVKQFRLIRYFTMISKPKITSSSLGLPSVEIIVECREYCCMRRIQFCGKIRPGPYMRSSPQLVYVNTLWIPATEFLNSTEKFRCGDKQPTLFLSAYIPIVFVWIETSRWAFFILVISYPRLNYLALDCAIGTTINNDHFLRVRIKIASFLLHSLQWSLRSVN